MIIAFRHFLFYAVFAIAGLYISIEDIRTLTVPLIPLYSCLLLEILIATHLEYNIINLMLGFLSLFAVFFSVYKFSRGLGAGDVHFSVLCGFVSGFPNSMTSMSLAMILAVAFILIKSGFGSVSDCKRMKIPLCPFMFAGVCISFLAKAI